jgi:dGTPase
MRITIADLRARLSPARFGDAPVGPGLDERGPYEADADRILFSAPFRLLADKTQVHGPSGNALTRSRLTHSLEVSRVARTLGNRFASLLPGEDARREDVGDVLAATGLLHDVGNPPFGHTGEDVASEFFQNHPLGRQLVEALPARVRTQFRAVEGNAQALRIATRLAGWRPNGGLCLTAATIAAFCKYPWTADAAPASKRKFGVYAADLPALVWAMEQTRTPRRGQGFARHPLAYLSEAADDICYHVVDVEDAAQIGVITLAEAEELLLPLVPDRQGLGHADTALRRLAFLRSRAIATLIDAVAEILPGEVEDLMAGDAPGDLVARTRFGAHLAAIKAFSKHHIYGNANRRLQDQNAKDYITFLLERTSEALLARERLGAPVRDPAIAAMGDRKIPYDREGWIHAMLDHLTDQTDRSIVALVASLRAEA